MDEFLTRRTALSMGLAGTVAVASAARASDLPQPRKRKLGAMVFDGFALLDFRALVAVTVKLFPDKGAAFAKAWTTRLFELSWIETSAGRYSGFAKLADAALRQVARTQDIAIDAAQRAEIVGMFGTLPVWPDVGDVLESLRRADIRLAFLSNLEERDLLANMRGNGIAGLMDPPLSTNRAGAFKPSPRAYAMAPAYYHLPAAHIGFVAFGGWDALGAKWFGFPTAWANRLGAAAETLDPAPDVTGSGLSVASELALRSTAVPSA